MASADQLRYFLHVARRGRLIAAAEVLGVDHTTVGRQISRLERTLDQRLFDRTPAGWLLTEAGHRLLPHAEAVEAAVQAASTVSSVGSGRLSGSVRIATPDAFGAFLLSPGLHELRDQHPELDVEIVTWTRNVTLGVREFDVAVTLEEPQPRHASYRPLADYSLGLYASRSYLAGRDEITGRDDLRHHPLIWYVDDLLDITPLRLPDGLLPGQRVSIQINSVTGHWQAAAAGLGIAMLPRYVADADVRLVPVLPEEISLRRRYWLAIPRHYVRHDRVQAVVSLLDGIVTARRPELLPR